MNNLLICAERLGIEVYLDSDNSDFVYLANDKFQRYDPRTNDAQAMELLKWLIDRTGYVIELWNSKDGSWNIDTQGNNGYQTWSGQTLNEAIIKAVVAMEDTHE